MVHYDGKDVYAAFESHEVATYFVRRVGLHKDYTMVSLASTEATDTKDDEHALVLKREAEVDRLLAAKMTSSDFTRNLLRLR
jgi:Arc/MetJ family transcription regulator